MSSGDWLDADARHRIGELVRAIEARTSAEIVVTVRLRSAVYREVDLAVGSALGLAALLIYVFYPVTFVDDLAPAAIASCYLAGALLTASVHALKRPLLSRGRRRAAVATAARAAFVDQGVGATRARTGILVYVSLFEREAEIVADGGVDVAAMGDAWGSATAAVEAAVRGPADLPAFVAAMKKLGEALAEALPAGDDDVNELPDELTDEVTG